MEKIYILNQLSLLGEIQKILDTLDEISSGGEKKKKKLGVENGSVAKKKKCKLLLLRASCTQRFETPGFRFSKCHG